GTLADERELAEDPARRHRLDHPSVEDDVDLAFGDGEHRVIGIALVEDDISRFHGDGVTGPGEDVHDRHAAVLVHAGRSGWRGTICSGPCRRSFTVTTPKRAVRWGEGSEAATPPPGSYSKGLTPSRATAGRPVPASWVTTSAAAVRLPIRT